MNKSIYGMIVCLLCLPLSALASTSQATKPTQLAAFTRVHESATSGYYRIYTQPNRGVHSYNRSNYQPGNNRPRVNVCYNRRQIFTDNRGVEYFRYRGCFRTANDCYSMNRCRFGRYGSEGAARAAMRRCQQGVPNLQRSPVEYCPR
jgi:hypothetical protein